MSYSSNVMVGEGGQTLGNSGTFSGTAWGAVLIGATVAITLQFVLTILGIAVGVSVGTGAGESVGTSGAVASVGGMAGVWWLLSGTVSLAVGGMVVGHLWQGRAGIDLFLHGLAMWSVTAIFGFLVIFSGVGIAASGESPLGILVGDRTGAVSGVEVVTGGNGVRAQSEFRGETSEALSTRAAAARKATQIASWWSVAGMLLGAVVTVGGAAFAAGPSWRRYVTRYELTRVAVARV